MTFGNLADKRFTGSLLVAITVLIYVPSWRNNFIGFDDRDYVTANPILQSGLTWAGARWAFTTFHSANWHPLTWLSLMLDAQLFGTGQVGFHVVNVCLHAANVLLLLPASAQTHRFRWTKRLRRRVVRLASPSRRIRGLGLRTQRRPVRVLLPAGTLRMGKGERSQN